MEGETCTDLILDVTYEGLELFLKLAAYTRASYNSCKVDRKDMFVVEQLIQIQLAYAQER